MEKIGESLKVYFKERGLTQEKIASQLGVTQGYVTQLLNGKAAFGKANARKWSEAFGLSASWLLTGEGEMLLESSSPNSTDKNQNSNIPNKYISHLLPMSAMGGSLSGFDEAGVRKEDCERVISPIANIDWVIPVCGDSMDPEYPNGSRVYVRQIDPSDFISWGNVYVLDTTNGVIIKMVVESDKEGYIRCVSLNPSGRYAPFDVPMRSIRGMYRVMLCVSVK